MSGKVSHSNSIRMKSKTLLYTLLLKQSDGRNIRVRHVPEEVCVVEPIATSMSAGFEQRIAGSFRWWKGVKCIPTQETSTKCDAEGMLK